MSKPMHTPGPWEWIENQLHPAVHDPDAGYVHTILEVENFAWGYAGHVSEEVSSHIQTESNANKALIAASPELLAALEWIVAQPAGAMFAEVREAARAAIAKAKGATP